MRFFLQRTTAVLMFLATAILLAGGGPVGTAKSAADAPQTGRKGTATSTESASAGSIRGTVLYRYDKARPWRYGRYYVRPRGKGELAEALVCLTDRKLRRKPDPKRKAKTWEMDQKNYEFRPELLAIRAGDSVQFLNSDDASHNVHSDSILHRFNVLIPPRGSSLQRVMRAGNQRPIDIRCDLHRQMRAWVFAFDHPYYQITGKDGRFELNGVPEGRYELVVVHPAGRLRAKQAVRVQAGQQTEVTLHLSPDDLEEGPSD